jgi:hydroxyacylglutathione hydrolase
MTRSSVGTRAAWIADPEVEVLLNAASEGEARRMARLLEAVGFRRVVGYLAGGTVAWREAGYETDSTVAVDVRGLAEQIRGDEVRVLDVREDDEWGEGHVPGSLHIPFHELRDGIPAELENGGKPVAIVCSAGNRSSIAASLLKRAGLEGVEHVTDGGVEDLRGEGIELVAGS